jgi:hypothetical protein
VEENYLSANGLFLQARYVLPDHERLRGLSNLRWTDKAEKGNEQEVF